MNTILHEYNWLCMHHLISIELRIVSILRLSHHGLPTCIVRNIRRCIHLGILVDLYVDFIIANDLFDSKVAIATIIVVMVFLADLDDLDVVHNAVSVNFQLIF